MKNFKNKYEVFILLVFVIMLFSIPTIAQNVNIPNAIFKSALLNNIAINTNADNEIQIIEANAFAGSINIASLGINDLTGLASFINLKEFNCSNNYFGDLDLSANIALEKLICTPSGINNLNVTSNPLLHYLKCSNTSINSLDVTNNLLLDTLICTTVPIFTTIDLSNNLALIYVNCSLNYLTSLVIPPNNTLKELNCSQNQNMNSLNVSGNSALVNLYCSGNFHLANLNILGNVSLKRLECRMSWDLHVLDVSTNTALEYLDINSCEVSNIDLAANPALTYLDLGYNGLTVLDLTNNTNLIYIDITFNSLSSFNVSALAFLKTLKAHGNKLLTLDLSSNTALEELFVRANKLIRLNIQNGNNNNLTSFSAGLNPFLNCIQVDEPDSMYANWSTQIDTASNFDTNCALNYPCSGLPIPTYTCNNTYLTSLPSSVSFTNTTPNQSQYYFLWSFGDGSLVYNNSVTLDHTYNTNGRFKSGLKLIDSLTGCTSINYAPYPYDIVININNFFDCGFEPVIDAISYSCQLGGYKTIGIEASSFPQGSTFQWNNNGIPIGGANDDTLIVTSGGHYSVTIYNTEGCPVVSWPESVNFNNQTLNAPTIIQSGQTGNCGILNMTLSASDSLIYDWSTGQTAKSISVTQAGIYYINHLIGYCDFVPQPICVSSSSLQATQICTATVDSITNHSVIIWEKDINLATAGYRIYKETSFLSNDFNQIAYVSYDSIPQFIDLNSNAALNTARYRICLVDTCGGLSFSEPARPISLKVFPGNGLQRFLSWTKYEGSTQNISQYKVYSGHNSNQLSYLASVPSSESIFMDDNPSYGAQTVYRIYADLNNPCDFNGVLSFVTQSNSQENENLAFAQNIRFISTQTYSAFDFNIVPNPNNGNFTLYASNQNNEELFIYDIAGKLILQQKLSKEINNMQIEALSKGTYIVRLINDRGYTSPKLMIVSY